MQAKLFGKRLMRARKNRQLTQLQLAERIGTSMTTISRYENGLSFPSKRRLSGIGGSDFATMPVEVKKILGIKKALIE